MGKTSATSETSMEGDHTGHLHKSATQMKAMFDLEGIAFFLSSVHWDMYSKQDMYRRSAVRFLNETRWNPLHAMAE